MKETVLEKMLERLFGSLASGPSLNCRPHASRQRIDLLQLIKLRDVAPDQLLKDLLGEDRRAAITGRIRRPITNSDERERTAEELAAYQSWADQEAVLNKLRGIIDDAKTYEQDTGVHVLSIGFPILSLFVDSGRGGSRKRIIAPMSFIPVDAVLRQGTSRSLQLQCRGDGADLVVPNVALLAWLERLTGETLDLFADERGEAPWKEVADLVCQITGLPGMGALGLPSWLSLDDKGLPTGLMLRSAPRSEELAEEPQIFPAAVMGLFPLANQGLLRDTQALMKEQKVDGPLQSFVRANVELEAPKPLNEAPPVVQQRLRTFEQERLVTPADPCQGRAVRLARTAQTLVVHGPPGTGKSQTIANIIADHLAMDQRVLFVCDKRTALDVVARRLEHLNLGGLCAVVHDPQQDRRELYKMVRQQLDDLPESVLYPQAERNLQRVDEELQRIHGELTQYHAALSEPDKRTGTSFHELVGHWLAIAANADLLERHPALAQVTMELLRKREPVVQEVLDRATQAGYATNPWRRCAGIGVTDFLARSMDELRLSLRRIIAGAEGADATIHAAVPPFAETIPLPDEAKARLELADRLEQLSKNVPQNTLAALARGYGRCLSIGASELERCCTARQRLGGGPLDGALATRLPEPKPTPEKCQQLEASLRTYAQQFAQILSRLRRVRSRAGEASEAVFNRWLSSSQESLKRAQQRIEQARPLQVAIERQRLERSLWMVFTQKQLDLVQIGQSLRKLDHYLETAGKWYAFVQSGRKKEAAPIFGHFDVPVGAVTGRQLREFLGGVQTRLELKTELDGVLSEALPACPTDEELLTAFSQNDRVIAAAISERIETDEQFAPGTIAEAEINTVRRLLGSVGDAPAAILERFGLTASVSDAECLAEFLSRAGAFESVQKAVIALGADVPPWGDCATLEQTVAACETVVRFFLAGRQDVQFNELSAQIIEACTDLGARTRLLEGLRRSAPRASAIGDLLSALRESALFEQRWLSGLESSLRKGEAVAETLRLLDARLDQLEGVLRVKEGLTQMPSQLGAIVISLINAAADPKEAYCAIRKSALASEIRLRLKSQPVLHELDGKRLEANFERYRQMEGSKRDHVRDCILHRWRTRQKERLLASTGGRLNSRGTELRRRLMIQGERAMRLRQVVSLGRGIEGGDPLFDVCPVWMASPETVAQLFPREPIFDVVVFDEASQCRLEEALPVLTRARRVVIAGDQQQLPPTRFFESAIATSEEQDFENEQQMFESQQGEVEDLLSAALRLEVDKSYLDVHYRSRNSDLIQFSNEHFYGSRLQPIPGHPSSLILHSAPLKLHRADGIYEKRCNRKEAEAVCQLVKDLLAQAKPPSIGIACFNLQQRDLIVDLLDELCEKDNEFAQRYGEARERTGAGSFEGLFVKNLENVQGDERDHIIISTTFGPDAEGKFYRRFGPIGRAGGGRRLNVLVTRAREQVHIVTSIPADAYRNPPVLEANQVPSGAWLLFAYLAYAEHLAEDYELAQRILKQSEAEKTAQVKVREAKCPSTFSQALARGLARNKNVGSDVHWGNEGFCIDLALHHPTRAEDVTIGVLCDMARFTQAEDQVEWDIFRSGILEQQGWYMHRIWTPHFFRDPQGAVDGVVQSVSQFLGGNAKASVQKAEHNLELTVSEQ